MEYCGVKINQILKELEKTREIYTKEYGTYPEGQLYRDYQGGRRRYFIAKSVNGKLIRKIITKDRDMIKNLARREYLDRQLKLIEHNIGVIRRMQGKIRDCAPEEIISTMKRAYSDLPPELFLDDNAKSALYMRHRDWCNENYKQSTYRAEDRIYITSHGLKVRSKSELLIAERLYYHGVPFRYEQIVLINGREYSPDFTFEDARREAFYWEYCGMMGSPGYAESCRRKRNAYEAAGIVPWKNIYYTFADEGEIDLKKIDYRIKEEIIPRM